MSHLHTHEFMHIYVAYSDCFVHIHEDILFRIELPQK